VRKSGWVVLVAALGLASVAVADDGEQILEFGTMVGVPVAFTGAKAPIRGINGGGLPWVVRDGAKGELKADGSLEVEVRGLVLADDPAVPPAVRLTNPIPNFRAIVSCYGTDGMAHNIMTGLFPADPQGRSKIEAKVQLPSSCIAPLVFVTSPGGAWFATIGK
jgi:hypothetical protein